MSLKKIVPLESLPLGIFAMGVIGFAGFRIYKLLNHQETILTKKDAEKFEWKPEKSTNSNE